MAEANDTRVSALLSVDMLAAEEAELLVDSPRSLRACMLEGIQPEQLLYKKPAAFLKSSATKEVAEMR